MKTAVALALVPAVSAKLTYFSNSTESNLFAFEAFKSDFGRT